jgi:hypothetical protein
MKQEKLAMCDGGGGRKGGERKMSKGKNVSCGQKGNEETKCQDNERPDGR